MANAALILTEIADIGVQRHDVPHAQAALGVCAHRLGGFGLSWKFVSLPCRHLKGRGLLFASSFLTALFLAA